MASFRLEWRFEKLELERGHLEEVDADEQPEESLGSSHLPLKRSFYW